MPYVWFLTCAIFSEHQKLYVKGQDIKQKICFCGRSKNCEKGLFVMCVCVLVRLSGWNNSAATGQISLKFSIWGLFEILSRKFKFDENWTRITGTLHEDQCTFIIIRRWILLRMRVFYVRFVQRIKVHLPYSIKFFSRKSRRLWDNVEKYCRVRKATQMTI